MTHVNILGQNQFTVPDNILVINKRLTKADISPVYARAELHRNKQSWTEFLGNFAASESIIRTDFVLENRRATDEEFAYGFLDGLRVVDTTFLQPASGSTYRGPVVVADLLNYESGMVFSAMVSIPRIGTPAVFRKYTEA